MREIEEIIARTVGAHYDGEVDPADTPNRWASATSATAEIVAALDAAGLVIVPKEATEEMKSAGIKVFWDAPVGKVYRAMLEARPK